MSPHRVGHPDSVRLRFWVAIQGRAGTQRRHPGTGPPVCLGCPSDFPLLPGIGSGRCWDTGCERAAQLGLMPSSTTVRCLRRHTGPRMAHPPRRPGTVPAEGDPLAALRSSYNPSPWVVERVERARSDNDRCHHGPSSGPAYGALLARGGLRSGSRTTGARSSSSSASR